MFLFRKFAAMFCVLIVGSSFAAAKDGPPLRIVYFVPADRSPCRGYAERLDRVMTEVQQFYRQGMSAAGYGPMTFGLERNDKGRLRIYLVHGTLPMQEYGRNDGNKVREEVKTALKPQGIDVDRETIVIFQVLLKWEDGKATEVGPYCGAETTSRARHGFTTTSASTRGCLPPASPAVTMAAHARSGSSTRTMSAASPTSLAMPWDCPTIANARPTVPAAFR